MASEDGILILAAYRDHHGGEVVRLYVPMDMADPDITAAVIKSYHAKVLQETRAHQSKVTR